MDRLGSALRNSLKLLAFVVILVTFLAAFQATSSAQAQRVGGPCSYDDFPGKAVVLSVEHIPQPEAKAAHLPYQPYRVFFTFTPSVPVRHPLFQAAKAHELTLSGGTPPGPAFLRKYGIKPGAEFKTDLHLIRSGTCSPVVFTFHGIDVYDFFELKK